MWTAEGRDTQGRPSRDRGSVSYNAAVESAASRDTDPQPAAFAQRVHREAIRRGFDTADRQVVIGDGAAWIWNVAAEQFPGAVEIVDIYHAKQHLCDVAKAIYGPGTDLADRWAKDRRAELDAGRLCAVVAALRIHVETTPAARKCIHYVFGNRHRTRYPQFRAKGLCVSSGVVEAGCKQIGARLKRTGMRWTVAAANAIIALRSSSVAASRTSGSDVPQMPPDAHLTMMSCTHTRGPDLSAALDLQESGETDGGADRAGVRASSTTVGQLLHCLGYQLQSVRKRREGVTHPDRNAQFEHINQTADEYLTSAEPVVSVDTK